jgi:alkanesulfonate monooxygenase SsuD/methylene tetrahydromethanopterin reductase-like flavin-dependent oxidoreductase (luciferase family)
MQVRVVHPWAEAHQSRVGWGLQAFAWADDESPVSSILDAGRLAATLGLDGFFVGDHPAYAPDPWLILTVLATETKQIRLGSVVLCASYRQPVVTARLAADLDNISAGRFILGLGHGWNRQEFEQLDIPFHDVPCRQRALEETIQIVQGVWGDEPFTFRGQFHSTSDEVIRPSPVQQPGPPLLLAGSGERTALRLVARYADACNFGAGHSTGLVKTSTEISRKNEILSEYCRTEGRSPASVLRTHFTSHLMIGPTEEDASRKRDRYYPQGLNDEQQFSRVVGSPEGVAEYYQSLVDAGMQYFVVQTLDARDHETINLLASEVITRVSL